MSRLLVQGRIDEYAKHLTTEYARTRRQDLVGGRDAALASWRAQAPTGPTRPLDLWVRVYWDAAVLTGAIARRRYQCPPPPYYQDLCASARAVAAGGAPRVGDPAALTPNLQMQPTGRSGPRSRAGAALVEAKQRKRSFMQAPA